MNVTMCSICNTTHFRITYILQSIVKRLLSLSLFAFLSILTVVCIFHSLSSLLLSKFFTGSYHVFSLRQALRDLPQPSWNRKPTRAGYTEGIILHSTIMTLFCLSDHPSHFLCSHFPTAVYRKSLSLLWVFISLSNVLLSWKLIQLEYSLW